MRQQIPLAFPTPIEYAARSGTRIVTSDLRAALLRANEAGLRHAEIAVLTGIPRGSVGHHLNVARAERPLI